MFFPYMFILNVYHKMVKYIVNNPGLTLEPEKLRIDLFNHIFILSDFGQLEDKPTRR